MKTVKILLKIALFITSMIAAFLWFKSAAVALPEMTWQPSESNPFYQALNLSATLNKQAAFATGVSVVLGAVLDLMKDGSSSDAERR